MLYSSRDFIQIEKMLQQSVKLNGFYSAPLIDLSCLSSGGPYNPPCSVLLALCLYIENNKGKFPDPGSLDIDVVLYV